VMSPENPAPGIPWFPRQKFPQFPLCGHREQAREQVIWPKFPPRIPGILPNKRWNPAKSRTLRSEVIPA
jgi:hypothetical protein